MFSHKNDNPRLLLAKLRKADYTHAGDEEAIDIFLEKINGLFADKSTLKVLDAGCGLGGTADYIRRKISSNISGIDIDNKAINHAQQNYPEVNSLECDILQVDAILKKENFDLIYLFNVFYALPDQQKSLQKLAHVAKPGAILGIFDYTQINPNSIGLKDLAEKAMNPIHLGSLKTWLKQTGWELIEIIDLSDKYDEWYSKLLENLKLQKESLLKEFTDKTYEKVLSTFSFLSSKIKNKEMGGSIIYAKHNETLKSRL
jgi:SAM-dependent methyltransferase